MAFFGRWVCGIGKLFGLRPAFLPLNDGDRTGGIGGAANAVARCDMPTGIAGINGLTRWMILDDPEEERIPPCVPNTLLMQLDACVEPARNKVTFRRYQGDRQVMMHRLPTGHQTISMMMFEENGWGLPERGDLENAYDGHFSNSISNPFALGDDPVHRADPRLCVHTILEHYKEFITDEELVALGNELNNREDVAD